MEMQDAFLSSMAIGIAIPNSNGLMMKLSPRKAFEDSCAHNGLDQQRLSVNGDVVLSA
jgi:hypothetical protein